MSRSSSCSAAAPLDRRLEPQQDRAQRLVDLVVEVLREPLALLLLGADRRPRRPRVARPRLRVAHCSTPSRRARARARRCGGAAAGAQAAKGAHQSANAGASPTAASARQVRRGASGPRPHIDGVRRVHDSHNAARPDALSFLKSLKPTPFEEFSRHEPVRRGAAPPSQEPDRGGRPRRSSPSILATAWSIVDVRETEEFAVAPPPRREARAARPTSRRASRRAVARPRRAGRPLLRLRQPLRAGPRARCARTSATRDVASMTGGIALWKDRGYEVDDADARSPPSSATATRATC